MGFPVGVFHWSGISSMIGWPQQRSSGDSGQRPGIFGRERLLRREAVFAAEAQRTQGHTEMVAKPARKSVAIVVPPSAQSLDVSGPLDAFLEANRQSTGGDLYDVRLIATGVSRNIKAGGMSIGADGSIVDDVRSIDTLIRARTPHYPLAFPGPEFLAGRRRRPPIPPRISSPRP